MKKLVQPLFWLTFVVAFVALFGHLATIAARPQLEENLAAQAFHVSLERGGLSFTADVTSTASLTLYLPIVLKSPPGFNPKKGLGVIAPPACTDLTSLKASWYINWHAGPDSTCGGVDFRFVPRIADEAGMQFLPTAIQNAQASGWLIGFSEPNLETQAGMSPTQGAELWKQIEDAALPANIKLVSPSPNQFDPGINDTFGNQWLWAMVLEYNRLYGGNPHFDAIGWNVYGCTDNPDCLDIDEMKQYLMTRRQEALDQGYDVPIWVLEYGGCLAENSGASDQAVMSAMTAWFNETPWIGRYAWFSNRAGGGFQGNHNCILIDNSSNLTALGQIYQGF